ncbi:hypothetical protein M407DRAFT_244573 [Tulasnella calospora MUT 4182]|uniref:Uncharacterized protein n=1 Tax=Tulasnella calospora MUT 4182 TaxID=1051891 RepID=A0A0C3QE47_9AGAM|nr:hypothetical protein M407DRAFT_244573 [Tulasnella calospora MUT 4182]
MVAEQDSSPLAGPSRVVQPPPSDAPQYLQSLYTQMQTSPFLEANYIRLSAPVAKPAPPPGFFRAPKGRRRRGGTDHGEGLGAGVEPHGQLWSWLLLLQVKEGTEGRGAVEYVAKLTRNLIIKENPGFHVPSKGTTKSRGTSDGWAMLDLGDHAVHVMSKSAREKWFSEYYPDLNSPQADKVESLARKLPFLS